MSRFHNNVSFFQKMAERHFTPIPGVTLRRFQSEVQRYFLPMLRALAHSHSHTANQMPAFAQGGDGSLARLGSVSRRPCSDAKSIIVDLFELCESAIFRATTLCLWGEEMFQDNRIDA
jgi:hypothetical protein